MVHQCKFQAGYKCVSPDFEHAQVQTNICATT